MKTLNKLLGIGALSLFSNLNVEAQNKINEEYNKLDSINNIIKTQAPDSSEVILQDRNKDKIIDKIIFVYYYPNKICLSISRLDTDYDERFETTVRRLSYKNDLIYVGEFEENLDDLSKSFKNEPEGRYKLK